MTKREFIKYSSFVVSSFVFVGCNDPQKEPDQLAYEDGLGIDPKDHLANSLPTGLKDIVATSDELALIRDINSKFKKTVDQVGFGNFNIISFDEAQKYAQFSRVELEFLEMLFFKDAKDYGFFGSKVTNSLTETISKRDVFKVPNTGHFLFRGESQKVYDQVKKDIGSNIILTSGVRSIPKQMHLFLSKTIECAGNYSLASRSLAPAGYSYHSIGDFDVGKDGFGHKNFTSEFANTTEYEKLSKLGYVSIRYPEGNPFGVYFEPWHIEVVRS